MRRIIYKRGFIIFLLISYFNVPGQVPSTYYDSADGLTGSALKQELHDIITANHNPPSYTPGVWDAYYTTDVHPSPDNTTIWDIYSNTSYSIGTNQCGSYSAEGDCYNREHSFPKSWFGGSTSAGPGTDLHHVFASDGYVNGQRAAFPFGEVTSVTYTSTNGSKKGTNSYSGATYTGTAFEPADDFKGDLARAYFYMATRYKDELPGWYSSYEGSTDIDIVFDATAEFISWYYNMLLEWHTNDPVSQKELDRNDAIYDVQTNANPFIDHPEYVCDIWGGTCGTAPAIENIVHSPSSPISSDAVSVTADITDDGTIASATLYWGTDGSTFPNSISMTVGTAPGYSTDSNIPAQTAGTTVYYKITAVDNDAESTTSSTNTYTIPQNAPTTQATLITTSSLGTSSLTLTWTNGNGSNRVVIMNTSNSFTNPSDGTDPTANSAYGGSGEQTIYNGSSNSVSVTGLTENTSYWFRVYEYNNSGINTKYITSTSTDNPKSITSNSDILSEKFSSCPASGWTIYSVASNEDWTCANGYLEVNAYGGDAASDDWFISSTINLDNYENELLSFTSYTQYSDDTHPKLALKYSTDYSGSGDPSSSTWNSLSYTSPSANSTTWTNSGDIDISGISGSSVYIAFQYTSSGTGSGTSSLWRIDDISLSGTVSGSCSTPSTQAGNLSFSSLAVNSVTASWTCGDGDGVIVKMNTSDNFTDPVDGTDPTANSTYSSGEQVVCTGSLSTVDIDGLSGDTSYYFRVYERNCSGSSVLFLTSGPAEGIIITPNATSGGSEETFAIQDFETTPATPTLSYTTTTGIYLAISGNSGASDLPASTACYSSSNTSWRIQNSTVTNTFAEIDISNYQDVYAEILLGSFSIGSSGNGMDATDYTDIEVSLDGESTWSNEIKVKGNTNACWAFSATGTSYITYDGDNSPTQSQPAGGALRTSDGYSTLKINIPDSATSIILRITASNNSDNESWLIDDIKILGTGSSYSTSNTDYFRTCLNGSYNSTSTWQSSDDNTNWYTSSLVPDINAICVTISDNTSITQSSDISMTVLEVNSGSTFSFSADNQTLTVSGNVTIDGSLDLSRNGTLLKLNGSALQTVSGSGTINLYNFELNNTNNATFTNDVTISNLLTLTNGIINSTADTITIDNSSESAITGSGISNYINGYLKRAVNSTGSYEFPVGSSSNYEYVKIDLNSSIGISYLTASFSTSISGTAPSLTLNSVNINSLLNAGIWTITPDAVTSVSYDITLISRGHNNGGISSDYHTILKRDNSSSDWGLYGSFDVADQSGSGTAPITLKRTGITGFSDFGGGSGDGPLPIELLSFNIKKINETVEIQWSTISETNNDYFTIQRSENGQQFSDIIYTPGAGNSNFLINYLEYDYKPLTGRSYYRIKQTDYNGNVSFSNVKSISIEETNLETQKIKNIFVDESNILNVQFTNITNHIVAIEVLNNIGQKIYVNNDVILSDNKYQININHFNTGIYYVTIIVEYGYLTKKVWIN